MYVKELAEEGRLSELDTTDREVLQAFGLDPEAVSKHYESLSDRPINFLG